MKEIRKEFEVKGVLYKIVFNLNVMEAIQDEYGSLTKWSDLMLGKKEGKKNTEANAKAIIFGLGEMMNEAIDIDNENLIEKKPFLNHKQVGRILTELGFNEATQKMQETIIESTKSNEKN